MNLERRKETNMYEEVNDELDRLKEMLEKKQMSKDTANNFISEQDYEDEYSHNEIDEFQSEFLKEAEKYLKENYTGQYVMFSDWCVHIVTIEFYKHSINPIPRCDHGIYC